MKQIHIRLDDETVDALEEWRARQKPIPKQATALRTLIRQALGLDHAMLNWPRHD